MLPRPDLSSPFVDVEEFRARAHDGSRFWGLRARCRLRLAVGRVRVRAVGPCDLPGVDPAVTDEGVVEYVYQELPGRRLEDRVLDAVRVAHVAAEREEVDVEEVEFLGRGGTTDEMRIAAQIVRLSDLEP